MAANKLATVFVITRRDGSLVEKKFPMDQRLYRVIKSLPKEEQFRYFTEEYYQWKEEQNDHRYLVASHDEFLAAVAKAEIEDVVSSPLTWLSSAWAFL